MDATVVGIAQTKKSVQSSRMPGGFSTIETAPTDYLHKMSGFF